MRKLIALVSRTKYYMPCAFYFLLLFPAGIRAQAPQSWTSAEMYQAIRKLNVLGSVLYVAAHPDDENTRLIAYLSKDRLYRTGYLSVTRGDGGQNLIGNEQGIELGLIRTQELLAARRIDGGEQFFTRAYDFGYSKNPEETFAKWDKEKVLADVVWIIRKFRPDVIITRFPTTGEGGHGHHTASAILANEAFSAAADPHRFPEQLKYVGTWQAKRVLWNSFNFGNVNLTSPEQFKFDVGGYNPLLGKSYGEIAAESRSQHKSQGFGVPAGRGEALEYFKTSSGPAPDKDLMDGVELSWARVKGGEMVSRVADSLAGSFDFLHPEKSVEGLVRLHRQLKLLEDGYWKTQKLKEVQELIAQCSGLFLDATTTQPFAVQTDSLRFNFSLNNRLGIEAQLLKVTLDGFDSSFNRKLERNKNLNFSQTLFIPHSRPVSQPYWLVNKMEEGYFNVNDQGHIGQPDADPAFTAMFGISIYGESFQFTRNVKYKFTDPVRGEVYWPVVLMPSYTLKVTPELMLWAKDGDKFSARFEKLYKSYKNNNLIQAGWSDAGPYSGIKGHSGTDSLRLNKESRSLQGEITAPPAGVPVTGSALGNLSYHFVDRASSQEVNDAFTINYDHIPSITYFKPASVDIRHIDAVTYHKKIGYIVGAGDKVPEALEQMGYEVTLLTNKELSRNNLSQFDAIITGVRAYNTNDWMNNHYDKLMRYVEQGGNLVVQYNTSTNIGPVRAKIGPYPFTITRTRVTDERSPVRLLKPDHPVFRFPNKITEDDFKGWVQERSIYHGADTTGKFEKLISMGDPGEKPDEGSLLIAKYGKGYFSYTGLVFFRQLPAGVPGAYRLLANLIALNKKKGF